MYAIMINPGHNRVYFETSNKLAVAELKLALDIDNSDIVTEKYFGSVKYIAIEIEYFNDSQIETIFKLSFTYAVFKVVKVDGEDLLFPISRKHKNFIDSSISSMLKYSGKTNEIFTRLMLNIGVLSLDVKTEKLKILDPIAGKGTTLYEGLINGYDVYGIEIGSKVAEESYRFMKKFLENLRYKHTTKELKQGGKNKSFSSIRYSIDISKDKETKDIAHYEMIAGNSVYANQFFRKDTFDLIVGDLPYGVQHGNVTNEKQDRFTRNPKDLLITCLPIWRQVLKPNGAIVLGWNTNVLDRDIMIKILSDCEYTVKNEGAYLDFAHKVDQAISRDIIVAVKTDKEI